MKRKTIGCVLSLMLAGSLLSTTSFSAQAKQVEAVIQGVAQPAIDFAIINEDRLAKGLQKRGIISPQASQAEINRTVRAYIQKKAGSKAKQPHTTVTEMDKKAKKFLTKQKNKFKDKMNKQEKMKHDGSNVTPAKKAGYSGPVRQDKVLVLLAEFPDFKHNSVEQEPGYMYADDFSRQHYQEMLFGDKEFTLFDGSKVQTLKQYYQEQSGGSYTVDGTVSEWLTVPGMAKEYGDDDPSRGQDNLEPKGPRDLVKDALNAAVASGINLAEYDRFDQYDLDGDGNLNEPDGLIDHLMIIHAGTGQEAGGGQLGDDAIWSHRWTLDGVYAVPNTISNSPNWGGQMAAYDYTIEPEDGATGVFAHEFGHDLGLPDEYDTQYSGQGEPVGVWSIMSGGSWAGKIAGTAPTSFSPQNKLFFQTTMGGNWANIKEVDAEDITSRGLRTVIDQSVTKSKRPGMIKVNVPDKEVQGVAPFEGAYSYFSTKGDDLNTAMYSPEFDLVDAKTAVFEYKAYRQIETGYDYLYIDASTDGGQTWTNLAAYDDDTHGWVDETIDLSAYAGQKVKLRFNYITDGGLALNGFLLDRAVLTVDEQVVFSDDAEEAPKFELDGFVRSNGKSLAKNYYLLEWRNYAGADRALAYARGAKYNTGLLVWYADESHTDNWVGAHPGEGFLGVVDSHAHNVLYFNADGQKTTANSTRYQIADAAFSFDKAPAWEYTSARWGTIVSPGFAGVRTFNDAQSYLDSSIPDAGRLIPQHGLKFEVTGEAKDNSAGSIRLFK
ncbi:immune inhibitor A domain-containing protein [Aneurinibacillus sp. REN35]|uniref:immune inhibitor A domain-containing protein n=1 Tax=Aneurinibacillus sp. REN35 TaxID=3237286 RepID=UPI0035292D4B